MVSSSRHKTARAGSTRRPHLHNSSFKPRATSYSHISIQPAPDDKANDEEDQLADEEEFIRNESIQTQIQEQLLYESKLGPSASQITPLRPQTFAEATMSTRRGKPGRRDSINDDSPDHTLSGPMSLESLGTFKYTFKRKKKTSKWAPFDMAAAETGSEVGTSELDASSRAVSPSPLTFVPQPQSAHASFDNSDIQSLATPNKVSRKQFEVDNTEVDTDPTPTQERFDLAVREVFESDESSDSLDLHPSDCSDTQSTKDRTEAAMSQIVRAFGGGRTAGEDAFDSLDWDPDLLPAAPDRSPDQVNAAPKAVAYTTVGSLVDPNAQPQFTAPNRIQREGSGRRPLISFVGNRHYDFQSRGPPPTLNMQHSMQYTQQLSQSPRNFSFSRESPPSSANSSKSTRQIQPPNLSKEERHVPANVQSFQGGGSQSLSVNFMGYSGSSASTDRFPSGHAVSSFKVRQQESEQEDFVRGNNIQAPVQGLGLEKMQTLQRLARFENPMQSLARSRLSEFSAVKSQSSGPIPRDPSSALAELLRNKPSYGGRSTATIDSNSVEPGELNLRYQFPPPGFNSSASQTNPLYGVYSGSSHAPVCPPGYPQPLTAGPPGQRLHNGEYSKTVGSHIEHLWSDDIRVPTPNTSTPTVKPPSPWNPTLDMLDNRSVISPFSRGETASASDQLARNTTIYDTIPRHLASKYYPFGLPYDMTGQFSPVSQYNQHIMIHGPDSSAPKSEEEKEAVRNKEQEVWFYDGQKKWGMDIMDHITDREEIQQRHIQSQSRYGPIGPPSKGFVIDTTCTKDELEEKTPAELAAPLINAAFGSLLAYAEDGTASRKRLSMMTTSPPWQIDYSDTGNESFFGEDWGPPPKRIGRDARYQGPFHDPRETHWE